MQSLDATTRPPSFSAMLSGGSDPCFGSDHGGHHDFTTLNGSSTGSNGQTEFGHLMNSSQHHHHHHHHSHHSETNNNNTSAANHNNNPSKPKKVPPPNGKKTKGRVKIKMEFIDNKLRRYTTFSKRKTGIMKKAYELSTLTGTQVMLLVASETGHVYTFATRKLQPMITSEAGKALIQTCLNSPDPPNSGDAQRMSATGYEETELTYAADPNGSDHGDTKDYESESASSDGDEPKDGTSILPLTANGLIPPNFAALFASASTAGFSGAKSGLSIGLVPSSQDGSTLGSGGAAQSNRSTGGTHQLTRELPTLSSSSTTSSASTLSSTTTTSSASTAQLTTVSPKSIRIKKEVPN